MSEASLAYKMSARPLWATWQDLFLNTIPPDQIKVSKKSYMISPLAFFKKIHILFLGL